jgi:methylmalonyl-CoA mutase N-terminal domain/subunit
MKSKLDLIEETYRQKVTNYKTWSGFEVKNTYTPEDAILDYQKDLGNPGEYPFTRGIHKDMYRGKLWTMRHEIGYGTPEDSNRRLKFMVEHGASGLDFIADNPTHLGMDSDHPMATHDIGRTGVPLTSLQDMEKLMDGIPMEKVSTFTNTFSACGFVVFGQYIALAMKRGLDLDNLRGQVITDTLHSRYCGYGPAAPTDQAFRVGADLMEYISRNIPKWNMVFPCYNLRETGINAVQEVAFLFSIAIAFIRELLRRGLHIDDFAGRISWIPSCHIDFFEEVAKIRAERRLWARIVKEWFGAKEPRSMWWRGAAKAAGCSLVPQQPLNNIARISLEALVAVLTGCQALEVTTFDEPICIPTDEAHRLSLRIQQVLAFEAGVARVSDPLGGSYYVEALTNKLENEIMDLIQKIEDMGGMVQAIKEQWVDREIDEALARYQDEVENKERIIVGSNQFVIPPEEDTQVAYLEISHERGLQRIDEVRQLKKDRDNGKVEASLKKLFKSAKENENIMPSVINAIMAFATIGEIVGTVRVAHGNSYDPSEILSLPFALG